MFKRKQEFAVVDNNSYNNKIFYLWETWELTIKEHPDLWEARGLTINKHPDLLETRGHTKIKHPEWWETMGLTEIKHPEWRSKTYWLQTYQNNIEFIIYWNTSLAKAAISILSKTFLTLKKCNRVISESICRRKQCTIPQRSVVKAIFFIMLTQFKKCNKNICFRGYFREY